MPIEIPCAQCGKLLQTPDDAAGKQARCPECGGLTDVPAPGASAESPPAPAHPPAPTPVGGSPFAGDSAAPSSQPKEPKPSIDTSNPYASSAYAPLQRSDGVEGLQHKYFDFGQITGLAWSAFSAQIGSGVLFALLVIVIAIVPGLVTVPLSFMQQGLLHSGQVLAALGVTVGQQLVAIPFNALNMCLMVNFGLSVLRKKGSPFDDLFQIGHGFAAVLGYMLIFFGIALLCFGPGQALTAYNAAVTHELPIALLGGVLSLGGAVVYLIIWLKFVLAPTFILDRRMPLFEAMSVSDRFMSGNKLHTFLIFLVVGVLSGLFVVVTCLIGSLFVVPYYAILIPAMYMAATGQFLRGPSAGDGTAASP